MAIRIEQLRKSRNLTQSDLAKELGLDQTAISNWERGKTYPDTTNQHKLADYFGVSIDYLLGRNNGDNGGSISEMSDLEMIRYAVANGLTLQDIKDAINLLIKIKTR